MIHMLVVGRPVAAIFVSGTARPTLLSFRRTPESSPASRGMDPGLRRGDGAGGWGRVSNPPPHQAQRSKTTALPRLRGPISVADHSRVIQSEAGS